MDHIPVSYFLSEPRFVSDPSKLTTFADLFICVSSRHISCMHLHGLASLYCTCTFLWTQRKACCTSSTYVHNTYLSTLPCLCPVTRRRFLEDLFFYQPDCYIRHQRATYTVDSREHHDIAPALTLSEIRTWRFPTFMCHYYAPCLVYRVQQAVLVSLPISGIICTCCIIHHCHLVHNCKL